MRIVSSLAALCCALALLFAASASAADSIYWSDSGGDSIARASLAGGAGANLSFSPVSPSRPLGTAIDSATGKLYWGNELGGSIGVSNLDGSESEVLDTGAAHVGRPQGLAIDPANGKIYWGDTETETIDYADLDGSGGGELNITGAPPVDNAEHIVIDPQAGRLYWSSFFNSKIGYANLDGTGGGEFPISAGLVVDNPSGVAIDAATGLLYWANYYADTIVYENLDGVGGGVLDTGAAPVESPAGLAIDPEAGEIYWANEESTGPSIGEASLAGGDGSQLDTSGATSEYGNSPVLLEAPKVATVPTLSGGAKAGSTLTCAAGTWKGDLIESFLYRAPERTAVAWTLNGAGLSGAAGSTLVAAQAGTYACQETATNGAGSTVAASNLVTVPSAPQTGAPPGTPTPPPSPPAPKVTKVKYEFAKGTAFVSTKVPGPGKVFLSGGQVVGKQVRSSAAGVARLKLVAKGKALKELRANGKVKVRVTIKFVADDGSVAKVTCVFVLRLKPR
jgi:DNA-binding beta-propeller fold protein YncE